MSTCISLAGEYGEHKQSDQEFVCGRCFAFDEDAAVAERDALRTQLDAVREALTKDRVIMVTRHNGYTREDYSNPLVPVKAIEAALAQGAPDGQQ